MIMATGGAVHKLYSEGSTKPAMLNFFFFFVGSAEISHDEANRTVDDLVKLIEVATN